tara:strand:+ start:81 stop:1223 length:1143 start_codon:yes stop_codon:yes gene_type:complete
MQRRTAIQLSMTSVATVLLPPKMAKGISAKVQPAEVIPVSVGYYSGWPTLAKRSNGQLVLVASGTRESHVCPFGSVQLYRSNDEGKTWLLPQTILDTPIDDRDAGILETDQGTLLATTFTSNAYVSILEKERAERSWDTERLAKWEAAHNRVTSAELAATLGTWMTRSTDGGITWSQPYDCILNSPHGPVQLSNGNQLYAGKHLWREDSYIGVVISKDDGKSWTKQAKIPTREGDNPDLYHELHAVEAPSGKLIVHIRNHNKQHAGETLQSESTDGGESWSVPHSIGVWGFPSHLLRLRDGRIVMSYGYRRGSMGNQARISKDEGKSWSEPITLSDNADNYDLGYTTTVELADGELLSVWYEKMAGSSKAILRQTRWSLV